ERPTRPRPWSGPDSRYSTTSDCELGPDEGRQGRTRDVRSRRRVTPDPEHTIIDKQRPNRNSDRRETVGANRKDRHMAEITAKVGSTVGLHARPAALLAEAAGEYDFEITIAGEGEPAEDALDASSVLSLMGLGAEYGHTVVLRAEGDGAEEALTSLKDLIETNHDSE